MFPKRSVFSLLFLLFVLAASSLAHADFDDAPTEAPLPQPSLPAGAVQFDSDFISTLMLAPHLDNYIRHTQNLEKLGQQRTHERDLAVFVEIFQFVNQFVSQFAEIRDKQYATVGDFRAYYLRTLPKMFPAYTRLQVEAFQTTTRYGDAVTLKSIGGGAGIRVDLQPHEDGKLTFSFMPVYGEQRSYSTQNTNLQGGTDYLLRSSVSVGYRHKINDYVEPGIQVFFQPQMLDFGQFRVYAETFIRLRVTSDSKRTGRSLAISEVSIVPKFVYWRSTDHSAFLGDPVEQRLGDSYHRLSSNLYGFMNLEFHFGL